VSELFNQLSPAKLERLALLAEVAKRDKEAKYMLIVLAFLGVLFVCEVVYILFKREL
jgi:hypothetical protein